MYVYACVDTCSHNGEERNLLTEGTEDIHGLAQQLLG